jgi:hypothetical protein
MAGRTAYRKASTNAEGWPSAFTLAIVIALAGAVALSMLTYFEYSKYVETSGKTFQQILDESNALREQLAWMELFLPKDVVEGECVNGSFAMAYAGVMNFSVEGVESRAIVFENAGSCPLTGFNATLNGAAIEPWYKPDMVIPGSRGVIILQPEQTAVWHDTEGTVTIATAQGVSISVRTEKTRSGITGYFSV